MIFWRLREADSSVSSSSLSTRGGIGRSLDDEEDEVAMQPDRGTRGPCGRESARVRLDMESETLREESGDASCAGAEEGGGRGPCSMKGGAEEDEEGVGCRVGLYVSSASTEVSLLCSSLLPCESISKTILPSSRDV